MTGDADADSTVPTDPRASTDSGAPSDPSAPTDPSAPSDPSATGRIDGDEGVTYAPTGEERATPCAYTDYTQGEAHETLPATGDGTEGLERAVWDALYGVEDPEMPVSIVDLGLLYGVTVDEERGHVQVDMTLTYSGCPARSMLTEDVESAVGDVEGVESVALQLVWNPPWSIAMVTEQGRQDLAEFGLSLG